MKEIPSRQLLLHSYPRWINSSSIIDIESLVWLKDWQTAWYLNTSWDITDWNIHNSII